jgi:hypothetical protein
MKIGDVRRPQRKIFKRMFLTTFTKHFLKTSMFKNLLYSTISYIYYMASMGQVEAPVPFSGQAFEARPRCTWHRRKVLKPS